MQVEIAAQYWKSHPEADKDGVMLKREARHQDTELRTTYSIKALAEAGIRVQRLGEDTGVWYRVKGREKMAGFLAANGETSALIT